MKKIIPFIIGVGLYLAVNYIGSMFYSQETLMTLKALLLLVLISLAWRFNQKNK